MESFVVGRLVESRTCGPFAEGGLPGYGHTAGQRRAFTQEKLLFQYEAYVNGTRFDSYTPYLLQSGGQALVLGLLDRVLPVANGTKIRVYWALTSLLIACAELRPSSSWH